MSAAVRRLSMWNRRGGWMTENSPITMPKRDRTLINAAMAVSEKL